MVWRSDSAFISINKVNVRRARLVAYWYGRLCPGSIPGAKPWYVTSHPSKLSLAIHSWVAAGGVKSGIYGSFVGAR